MKKNGTTSKAGLTLAELVIGMAVTALVGGAVGALMTAVSTGWEVGQDSEKNTSISTQSVNRITKILRSARQIGAIRTGSISSTPTTNAAVLFWKGDWNYDGKIQLSEIAELEFDSANSQIVYREMSFPSSWTTAQKQAADTTLADSSIWSDSEIDAIKDTAYSSMLKTTACAPHVSAVEFHRVDSSTTVRPGLEFAIKFTNDGVDTIKYGVVTSRAPATLPTGYP